MLRTSFFVIIGLSLLAIVAARGPILDALDGESTSGLSAIPEIAGYQRWTRLSAEPRNVSASLWGLCRMTTPLEEAFLQTEHNDRFLLEYVNEIGREAMWQTGLGVFPVGTVIVKEKLLSFNADAPVALGVMIKREAGFNPNGGDWEYLYWEQPDVLVRGSLDNCQSCHLDGSARDSVFFGTFYS